MRFLRRLAGLSWLSLLLGGCGDDLTQLVVVVDTDLAVPAEIDRIDLAVDGPTENSVDGSVTLADDRDLPFTLGLTPAGAALGPVTVTATALRAGTRVLDRRVRARFVRGETLMLRVSLLRACANRAACPGADETCVEDGTCGGIDVGPADLPAWIGRPARLPGTTAMMDASIDAETSPDASPPPDAGADAGPIGPSGCPAGTCDPAAQTGCSGELACDLFTTGDLLCRPQGSGGDGATCANSLDCIGGYTCVHLGSPLCRRLCCAGDGSVCPSGQACSVALISMDLPYDVCTPSGCDPVEQTGCAAAQSCYPLDAMGGTICIAPEGTGMQGAACSGNPNQCARGFFCDGLGTLTCLKMCRAGGGEPSCGPGTSCRALSFLPRLGLCNP